MRTCVVSAGIVLALDLVWRGLRSPPLYRSTIGSPLRSNPALVAAAIHAVAGRRAD